MEKIKGKTYLIKGGTNCGLYLFNDSSCVLIDVGGRGVRIIKILKENNINLKYIINTHEHNDHYGACEKFRENFKDVLIMSSPFAKLYIENQELSLQYIMGGFSNIFMEKFFNTPSIKIDKEINYGKLILNECEFEIIDLSGHTKGSIGILTDDKVLFVGDLLVGEKMLKKYDFLFLYDIKKYLDSLDKLKDIDFEYLVMGHGKDILSKEESFEVILNHKKAINKYVNQVKNILKNPTTLENILKEIIINNNLSYNYKEYHNLKSSLVSMISYLSNEGEIDYILEGGSLLYKSK
jgi:glyoxylase-like metal-dependent hydrolase (beta-lactamase superfamily II)